MLSRVAIRSRLATRTTTRTRTGENGLGLGKRGFACSVRRRADFTHAVIGGGAVGLAVARQLAGREGTSTVLLERNGAVGMETSSRNSEVIHAGLYYGKDSLKTRLCIRGRQLLYTLCRTHSIPHSNTGKWIVAQTPSQFSILTTLHQYAQTLPNVPTEFIPLDRASKEEPYVHAEVGILSSPSTGIVDSHSYMQFLLGDLEEKGGDVALNCAVTRISPLGNKGSDGWEITTRDHTTWGETTITAETIINSAGLGAVDINNLIVGGEEEEGGRKAYYAKGNYFSYGASLPTAKHLIYPVTEPGAGGLGTHLTMDISGRIRFGPDVEWVHSPNDLSVNENRLEDALKAIREYFPGVKEESVQPDYAGIRPKLKGGGGVGEEDFIIRLEEGWKGWVNLLGIESPGLTSSLAIGEEVEKILYGSAREGELGTGERGRV